MREDHQNAQPERQRTPRGFSLIELLIVIAVILIIAAIAIPNFIRSKMRANETAAAENIRTISTAEVVYNTTYGVGFSPTLISLAGDPTTPSPSQAGLIDSVLGSGTRTGYQYSFNVVVTDPSGNVVAYSVTADPVSPGLTGDRHFYSDQTDVIRSNVTNPATASDSPIQ
jgi:type IV pilus assembly protein PilA